MNGDLLIKMVQYSYLLITKVIGYITAIATSVCIAKDFFDVVDFLQEEMVEFFLGV